MTGNPCVLVDEADKAANGRHNGNLTSAMLPFLEVETSRRYPDPYVQSPVDLSHVSFLLTANDELILPEALRNRLKIIRIPMPGLDHLSVLARTIAEEIAAERGAVQAYAPRLDGEEMTIAADLWRGGSLRRLRAIVERLLARRDEQATRH
jgi:hypothetical protein